MVDWDDSVLLWDLTTAEELKRFRHKNTQAITALALSPDGHHALSALTRARSGESLVYLYGLPAPGGKP